MNLNEIKSMAAQDSIIDQAKLDIESLKIPQLHNKYLNFYTDEKLLLSKYEFEFEALSRLKWEYYSGKMSPDKLKEMGWEQFELKILRQDVQIYLNGDKDLTEKRMIIQYQKDKVAYLDTIMKTLSNRNWVIRNAIQWRMFLAGQ